MVLIFKLFQFNFHLAEPVFRQFVENWEMNIQNRSMNCNAVNHLSVAGRTSQAAAHGADGGTWATNNEAADGS